MAATTTPPPTATEEKKETELEKKDGKNEVEVEVTESDEDAEGDDAEGAQKEEAIRLYKALKDPRSAGPLILALAQNAGINLNATPTQKEIKSETKSILSIFEEELGEDYKFLATKLSKAVEGALNEHAKQQEVRFAELAQSQVESQVDRAYEKLARETKGESKRLENRMAQLADEIPIGKQDVDTYIRRLYSIAVGESSSKSATQNVADRIRRNSSDASARIKGSASGVEVASTPEKKMSLKESVEFAIKQQTNK